MAAPIPPSQAAPTRLFSPLAKLPCTLNFSLLDGYPIQVGLHGLSVVRIANGVAFVVADGHAVEHGPLFAPASKAQILFNFLGGTGEDVPPVGVGLQGPFVSQLSGFWRGEGRGASVGKPNVPRASVVFPSLLTDGQIFLGIQHVGAGGWSACAVARPVGHLQSFACASFGGDQDDAIGSARAVDACGGCVFEHFHAFDVVGVEAGQWVPVHAAGIRPWTHEISLVDWDAVHDIQGVATSRE